MLVFMPSISFESIKHVVVGGYEIIMVVEFVILFVTANEREQKNYEIHFIIQIN